MNKNPHLTQRNVYSEYSLHTEILIQRIHHCFLYATNCSQSNLFFYLDHVFLIECFILFPKISSGHSFSCCKTAETYATLSLTAVCNATSRS